MPYYLAVLSGVLAFAARRFVPLSPLMWVALVPLLCVVYTHRDKVFKVAFCFGLFYVGLSSWWFIGIGSIEALGIKPWYGVLIWVAVTLLGALEYGLLFFLLNKRNSRSFWCLWTAGGVVLLEMLKGWDQNPFAFPWQALAYSQSGALMQSVNLWGTVGLSFLIVLVNSLFARSWLQKKRALFFAALLLFAANAVYGMICQNLPVTGEPVAVSLVQDNVSSKVKWTSGDRLAALSALERRAKGDLVVFSESVYVAPFSEATASRFGKQGRAVLIGALDKTEGGEYVSLFLVENGKISAKTDKRHLIPLAEYVPFLSLSTDYTAFAAGEKSPLLGACGCPIMAQICYDSCFEGYSRRAAEEGAALLVVATNDSWFDGSQEPVEHRRISAFRAAENGRFLLHTATTGQTAVIDPHGRTVASLPPSTEAILEYKAQFLTKKTLYTRIGSVWKIAAVLIMLWILIQDRRKNK